MTIGWKLKTIKKKSYLFSSVELSNNKVNLFRQVNFYGSASRPATELKHSHWHKRLAQKTHESLWCQLTNSFIRLQVATINHLYYHYFFPFIKHSVSQLDCLPFVLKKRETHGLFPALFNPSTDTSSPFPQRIRNNTVLA